MSGPRRPIYVVVPVRDRLDLTSAIVDQLVAQGSHDAVFVYDNGSRAPTKKWLCARATEGTIELVDAAGMTIYEMWNAGAHRARARHAECHIAFLNNDLVLGSRMLERLAEALDADGSLWAVSPDYDGWRGAGVRRVSSTFKNGGLAGFAFMVRGEVFDRIGFDERFEWWYGDDDFVAQILTSGGEVGVVGDASVRHIDGGSQTSRLHPELCEAIQTDRRRMWEKWGHL